MRRAQLTTASDARAAFQLMRVQHGSLQLSVAWHHLVQSSAKHGKDSPGHWSYVRDCKSKDLRLFFFKAKPVRHSSWDCFLLIIQIDHSRRSGGTGLSEAWDELDWAWVGLGRGVVENVSGLVSGFNTGSLCSYNNIECNHISAVALKFKGAVEWNWSHAVMWFTGWWTSSQDIFLVCRALIRTLTSPPCPGYRGAFITADQMRTCAVPCFPNESHFQTVHQSTRKPSGQQTQALLLWYHTCL